MADTMGMTQGATFVPEIVANKALGMLEAELHLAKNVARHYEYTPAKEGDKVIVPKRGTLLAKQKTSGSAVTLQNPTADSVEVTLDQHWEVTFALEDILRTNAKGGMEIDEGYIADAIQVLGEKIETSLSNLVTSLSNTRGTVATDITDAVMLQCRGDLSDNRAPQSDRFLYLEPDQINAVLALSKFVNAEKYGSSMPVMEGEFGKIYSFRVFESLFTKTVTGSPTAKHNIAMHRNAMVLASRPLKQPKGAGVTVGYVERNGIVMRVLYSYNADQLADQITIDTLFGVATLRPELGVNLLS